MSLNLVISPVGVWEVEAGSVVSRWYRTVIEMTGVAYVLLRGLVLLGSVMWSVSNERLAVSRLTPRLGPWSTAESPGMALCSAKSLSGALVATSSSAMFAWGLCVWLMFVVGSNWETLPHER